MDFLKGLVNDKKRELDGPSQAGGGKKKWQRRGEKKKEEEPVVDEDAAWRAAALSKVTPVVEEKKKAEKKKEEDDDPKSPRSPILKSMLSKMECFHRLRSLGQPITLFAETDKHRHIRTMKAQAAKGVLEEDMHKGQRNDYMRDMENRGEDKKGEAFDLEKDDAEEEIVVPEINLAGEEIKKIVPVTLEGIVQTWLKGSLKEWERHLEDRPDAIKSSVQGRSDTAMQKQTRRYLKPLIEKLDTKTCPQDILSAVSKMINLVDKRLYLKANDCYLQLCIGNHPWPVGCTSTGIHERTGRNRITEANIAHIMNDENTRKFLQAFKRVITFKQSIYPNPDKSKNIG